jgi:hypothetical protein
MIRVGENNGERPEAARPGAFVFAARATRLDHL